MTSYDPANRSDRVHVIQSDELSASPSHSALQRNGCQASPHVKGEHLLPHRAMASIHNSGTVLHRHYTKKLEFH
ncbi:hypothetical protein F2P81_006274 [Scophthalmus maximus]|uniref:Uncharacterized protein n=1 Tax=Scophthalmus maximus TaxID=52904 RepID=A0A6A4SYQ2_SCOMX|nr:hypothetical protein F2P81_006274 [Scophthalmus maximus]